MIIPQLIPPGISSLSDAVQFGLHALEPYELHDFLKAFVSGEDVTPWILSCEEDWDTCLHYGKELSVLTRTNGEFLDDPIPIQQQCTTVVLRGQPQGASRPDGQYPIHTGYGPQ